MKKDHSCEFPFCIRPAPKTCDKCHKWLCSAHLKKHLCKSIEAWEDAQPILDSLHRADFEVDKKGKLKIKISDETRARYKELYSAAKKARKGPTRREWHKIIDR